MAHLSRADFTRIFVSVRVFQLCAVIWATRQLGDSQQGENRTTGLQSFSVRFKNRYFCRPLNYFIFRLLLALAAWSNVALQ